jgi:hypothetical protein
VGVGAPVGLELIFHHAGPVAARVKGISEAGVGRRAVGVTQVGQAAGRMSLYRASE